MLKDTVKAQVEAFLKADNSCWGRSQGAANISLGSPDLYRAAVDDVQIVIDANLGKQGLYEAGPPPRLSLLADPSKLSGDDLVKVRINIRHELTHRLEDRNGDFDDMQSHNGAYPGFDERNAEYMEAVYGNLTRLQVTERNLRPGSGVNRQTTAQGLGQILKGIDAGSSNAFRAVPDLSVLQAWTGFHVDPQAVENLYTGGLCGNLDPADVNYP